MDRFRRSKTDEQDNTSTAKKIDIENSPVWKVLSDSSLDAKEQAEKIAELLHFNEEDLEANPKAIAENQEVVKYLLSKGADPNTKMSRNVSLLRVIRDLGNTEMVAILEAAGAKDDGCHEEKCL